MVFAIGNPFGLNGSMSRGIISSIRSVRGPEAYIDEAIQTDAAINPGAHKSTAVVIDELFAFVRTGREIHWSVNITQGLCLRC